MDEIPIIPRSIRSFERIVGEERTEDFADELDRTRVRLNRRTIWHINSTAAGGGVSEMLQSVLSYLAGVDIDVRWLVIEGSEAFFEITKRIHHLLHGSDGDGGPLGDEERRLYERTLGSEEAALGKLVRPGDAVVLHDPQVLGLGRCLAARGAAVIWSCHIGADSANRQTRRAWRFLLPYVADTAAQTFTRPQYRWENLAESRVAVIPPCIDAFATKNQPLDDASISGILDAAMIVPSREAGASTSFFRQDGTPGSVTRQAQMIEEEPIPRAAPIVCQVSRWDPLKDHGGLMEAFASQVSPQLGAHLVLAGPSSDSVGDDPESQETYAELVRRRGQLPLEHRRRIHVCSIPMNDLEENAAIVNALQRRSAVIVQKSLAEGFGLTVAEAMWKGRPTVGSRVGGIQDQIEAGHSGLLVDPIKPEELGAAVTWLLSHCEAAATMGENGRQRVAEHYLAPNYLANQLSLVREVLVGIDGMAHTPTSV